MSESPSLNPAVLEMVSLGAAIAARCPSKTQEMLNRLTDRGVPDNQLQEVVAASRQVVEETQSRANQVIDAVMAGEQLESCMQRMMKDSSGSCCSSDSDSDSGCCGGPADEQTQRCC